MLPLSSGISWNAKDAWEFSEPKPKRKIAFLLFKFLYNASEFMRVRKALISLPSFVVKLTHYKRNTG